MKNWTIGKRITLGFATLLVLVGCLSVTAFILLKNARAEADYVSQSALASLSDIAKINMNIAENQIRVLRHAAAKSADEKKKFEAEITAMRDENQKLMADYKKNIEVGEEEELFKKMELARDGYVAARTHFFELSNAGKTEEALAYENSTVEPAYQAQDDAVETFFSRDLKDANESSIKSSKAAGVASLVISWLSVVVILLGVAFGLIISTGLNRVLVRLAGSLNDGSAQVASAAGQVSSASQTLAEGSGAQAASIEESSSSLEELSSMTKRNSENAQKANDLAKEARHAADKGVGDMQTMVTAMEAIKISSDDIAKIIRTIDEIAFQTNILALNAAVEAARAGEAGMGFAVVADEVRNLAQRCAQAAKETAVKIDGAIIKTGQGVDISGKVAAALSEIVTKVRQVDELVTEVAGASREQTQGITQINIAVAQMDKVTQSNAATAEESAAAAEELNAQAETMKQSVAELLQLVKGQSDAATDQAIDHARPAQNHAAKTVVKHTAPHKSRNGNGNGHAAPAMTIDKRRSEIPLEGDFKDF